MNATIGWANTVFRTEYSINKHENETGNYDYVLKYHTLTGLRGFPQPLEANACSSLRRTLTS
jgi:hypothetical protein